eukprot:TRINITY_DN1513_c0_g1_i4.p1 TRINITY_DN1513_c0_g1~~TRINITY_DN1513_c0_g1_i4.p1  ORF type:complete len:109 (-),score=34.31 TRINITY_DN1513_c0_g1_i4:27-353(-)
MSDTSDEYLAKRNQEMMTARSVFLKAGTRGAIIYGSIGSAFAFLLPMFRPSLKTILPMNLRAAIASSAAVAGFWIYGEPASTEFVRQQHLMMSQANKLPRKEYDGQIQ